MLFKITFINIKLKNKQYFSDNTKLEIISIFEGKFVQKQISYN